ncbi:ABC transporter ATP-binding protein [Micromonospora sp. ALFpr18c]|uniref:ABC transporter ATP-binding protein n=1 Tax=unclassified Micromonospora TaxID=2617518 RepID=UPI00124B4223|nr:ABC transporter ATP-binding protein [Micromonospora sp. ALFpr18c]KAB1934909.1 ABC transporter ATP-binding protein [Micromonospora sp. ALFpr18c]
MSAAPLLTVRDLVAGYGNAAPVLRSVSFDVEPGSITAVVGANGAGKTTLMRALSGLIRPAAGELRFDDVDLREVPVERRVRHGLAHVPQGHGVVAELTVDENLRLGGLWRRDRADARRAVAEVYEMFEPLALRRRHAGHQLSGGERQMLALGRALVGRPRLLLLDEPSLGLAPKAVAQTMALLRRLRDESAVAVLLAEQSLRGALSVADRGIVMSQGQLVFTAPAKDLRDNPHLRQLYLGF